MTALERYVLEYLSDRPSRALEAQTIAGWIEKPLPKVTAALTRLRERGFVEHFAGHPGAWSITGAGRAVVVGDVSPEPIERYRLALELIADGTYYSNNEPRRIAKAALS